MTDHKTIDRLGPAPIPLSETSLSAARARLDSAITQAHSSVQRRPRRRLPLLAAAAAAAVGLAVAPALVGSDNSIALAAVDPMTFPWTPSAVPAGLGEPVFEKDSNFIAARYGDQLNGISITTDVAEEDFWTIPAGARSTDVDGDEAKVYERTVYNGSPESANAVTVVWKDDANDWTAVTGSGQYADGDRMVTFAEALRDQPQRVDLSLSVAPAGWTVAAYKEDRILTLSESGEPDDNDLTVALTDHVGTNLSAYGAEDESAVTINGRPALLGRQASDAGDSRWILEANTASGQAFALQAPDGLTRDQVIAVAEGVTYEP
ncbi:MAG: hypothetical protein V9G19_02335 [Tetrasphaera sp.]